MHAAQLSMHVRSLVLIAQAVFPFRTWTNRQTDEQTDVTEHPTHAGSYTSNVGNYYDGKWKQAKQFQLDNASSLTVNDFWSM